MSGEGLEPPVQSGEVGKPAPAEISSAPGAIGPKMPPGTREFFATMMSGPMPHPLLSKIDSEHIHKIIDFSDKDADREFKSSAYKRRYAFAALLLAALFVAFLLVYMTQIGKTEYVTPILTALVGAAGGYGIGFARGRKTQ